MTHVDSHIPKTTTKGASLMNQDLNLRLSHQNKLFSSCTSLVYSGRISGLVLTPLFTGRLCKLLLFHYIRSSLGFPPFFLGLCAPSGFLCPPPNILRLFFWPVDNHSALGNRKSFSSHVLCRAGNLPQWSPGTAGCALFLR